MEGMKGFLGCWYYLFLDLCARYILALGKFIKVFLFLNLGFKSIKLALKILGNNNNVQVYSRAGI